MDGPAKEVPVVDLVKAYDEIDRTPPLLDLKSPFNWLSCGVKLIFDWIHFPFPLSITGLSVVFLVFGHSPGDGYCVRQVIYGGRWSCPLVKVRIYSPLFAFAGVDEWLGCGVFRKFWWLIWADPFGVMLCLPGLVTAGDLTHENF